MKNKKILYFIIFTFIFVFFFCLTIFLLANMHWFYPYQTFLEYTYDSKLDDRVSDLKTECENLLLSENDYDKFITDYSELRSIYSEIGTYYKIEYLNVCNKPLKGNKWKMNQYLEKENELSNWFGSLYSKIYESNYKNQFFEGKNENDIQFLIKYNSKEANDQFSLISNIQDEYINLSDEEQINQFNSYFAKLVNANNQYAKIVGYNNYYDFANEKEYSRDYSIEDIIQYANYLNTYFIGDFKIGKGLAYESTAYYKKYNLSFMKSSDNLDSINYSNYEDSDNNIIQAYSESLGSNYYNEYIKFKNEGYLITSNEEDCYDGGFTTYLSYYDKPVMYLGNSNYQNVFTYLHEFGHYYNFTSSKSNDVELDLCETQSQGNELLFLSYLLKTKTFTYSHIRNLIAKRLQYFVQMAINTAAIGLTEYEAYNKETFTEADSLAIINQAIDKYLPNMFKLFNEESFKKYLMGVIIDHPMYYFSYSTSICSAINLFSESLDSYSLAKEKYLYIQNYDNYAGYVNTLTNAGLLNPFEEDLFIDLENLYTKIEDKIYDIYS